MQNFYNFYMKTAASLKKRFIKFTAWRSDDANSYTVVLFITV